MLFYEKKKYGGLLTPIIIIILGVAIVGLNVTLYESFLPQTITNGNSYLIRQQAYAFYIVLVAGKIVVLFGIRKLYLYYKKIKSAKMPNETTSSSLQSGSISSSAISKPSLISIIVNIVGNRNYSRIFLPVVVGYGLFYSIVSSMLIIRTEGFHHTMGVAAPYAMMMTHGPIGYAPSIALAVTEYAGFLIIPINLVILCVVSGLVGLNAVLSTYAFLNRPKKNKMPFATHGTTPTTRVNGSPLMAGIGASAGIFAVCPTCASLYIFGILTGSFASSITTFGVAFYGLFAAISIPLLLISPFVTALSLRKTFGAGVCYLKK